MKIALIKDERKSGNGISNCDLGGAPRWNVNECSGPGNIITMKITNLSVVIWPTVGPTVGQIIIFGGQNSLNFAKQKLINV
jgi:hypothetical protein